MMKISYYAYTNKGGRPNNEDSICCGLQNRRGVFVLADGLGGHSSGEVASGLAAQAIWEGCAGAEILDSETLKGQLEEANRLVLEGQKVPGREDMKTTAVALALEGDLAFWAHVGDSRLYRFSDGQLVFATRDHSVTYMKYLGGEISYMDVYHDDDRSSLLRAMGNPVCTPEGGEGPARPGDAFLLCSDGFWEFVYNEEMLVDCLKSKTSEEWARRMLLRHIRRTPPGNDNFSLIAVFVEE